MHSPLKLIFVSDLALTGHANTTGVYYNSIDVTGGPRPPVLSIASEYMGMVLAYSCVALEAQIFHAYPHSLRHWAP